MQLTRIAIGVLMLLAPTVLQACGGGQPTAGDAGSEPMTAADSAPEAEKGTLVIRANGEDFVRQGFTSKDGWVIAFDHVYVTLAEVTASQTDPPFDPEAGGKLEAKAQVSVPEAKVVDLAEGDDAAEPILVAELDAPAGQFNALAWQMPPAAEGPSQGHSVWMQGTATKDSQTIPFTIRVTEELAFTCGDFVGDERKGILAAGDTADLEATFHFDHLFGDGDAPADDAINTGALGFAPLAALASNGEVNVDSAALEASLSEADHALFLGILPSLGHVGEGHCQEVKLTS
ncbi:MAG: DUF4382 domain-containing protein [Leptolyngbyaceae cyanobacterium SM2_5_2]|nr:DUF4382 domain-containing protein [Leptolyngbyaceae cyanobacterium SM2_5_2]